ncbi:MAG: DUF4013 domain-containing protein [Candidatus Nanoarchaeia archaeon]|jgi:hypothetical protein
MLELKINNSVSVYGLISKDWGKTLVFCLIAALTEFIPVFGRMLLLGISIKVMSNAIKKKDEIPNIYGDIKEDFLNGVIYYILHAIILSIITFFILLGPLNNLAILGSEFLSYRDAILNGSLESISSSTIENIAISELANFGVIILIVILFVIFVPIMAANFADSGKFLSFFNFKKIFRMIFGNFWEYMKMLGVMILYSIVIGIVGVISIVIVIGPLIASSLMILVSGKIIGDWYREASAKIN